MPTETLRINEWLTPVRQALDTYRDNSDRMFDLVPSWESLAPDEDTRNLARLLHRAARARAGVAREWLISPLWLTGVASPSDLSATVQNVIEADRTLGEAWANLLRGRGREAAGNARQAIAAASAAIDRSEELNAKAAESLRTSTDATARASEETAATSIRLAERVVEQTEELVSEGQSAVIDGVTRFNDANVRAVKKIREAVAPVKGNVSRGDEKIFHVPGQASYEQLQTETLFATQSEAIAAGYRIARSPGGPSIKGNIARDGTRIYHMPGQVNYERVEAEALFVSEEAAGAEGFRPAQR